MDTREAITSTIQMGDMVSKAYLGDLSDEDLMRRPHAECNHINWQIGHLIASDHQMVSNCYSGSLPELPEGFVDKYSKENSANNDPGGFATKEELMSLMDSQHAAILEKLKTLSDDDLDIASPEEMRGYAPTVGSVFNLIGAHWLMHCGQWVIVRREVGRDIVI